MRAEGVKHEEGMQVHVQIQPLQAGADNEECVFGHTAFVFNRVQHLKEQLQNQSSRLQGLKPSQLDLVYEGTVLSDSKMLMEYGLTGCLEEPCVVKFAVQTPSCVGVGLSTVDPRIDHHCSAMKEVVEVATQGMLKGIAPQLEEGSTGGTYRLFGPDKAPVAVLKPCDEEAFAPRNPRAYVGPCGSPGFVTGTYSGTGAHREVAAYVLDHGHFAGVPKTTLVQARHPALNNGVSHGELEWKSASLQEFVDCSGSSGDYTPRFFSTTAVQRIAILDIRIVNLDRNEGNLLVCSAPGMASPSASSLGSLIPIDHGACLPDAIGATADNIAWMSWPQAKEPFGPEELAYIRALDVDADMRYLSEVLEVDEACLRIAWATTQLLKFGAEAGWTAYDVGKMIYRADFEEPSPLEMILDHWAAMSGRESPKSSPSPFSLDRAPAPELTMRIEFTTPTRTGREGLGSAAPFPSLSLDSWDALKPEQCASTPSTRASSPLTGAPAALELPRLRDFEQQPFHTLPFLDLAEGTMQCPATHSANAWPTERTQLFRRKVEEAIQNLCRVRPS